MKMLSFGSSLLIAVVMCFGTAFASNENASELATQSVGPVNQVLTPAHWTTLLSADFKKPGHKDLFILVTLECGLYTGSPVDASADASVVVRVLIDGVETTPGVVSICGKSTGSTGTFGELANCKSNSLDSCGFEPDDRAELARSLHSHGFNFLYLDVPKGIQNITVQGSVAAGPTTGPTFGVIGKGSLEALVVNLKEEGDEGRK
ncbi:MAG: hypothetical protein NVS9B13_02330 [Candidatus Acidiferrum sp.]